jgi:hypothetical protein
MKQQKLLFNRGINMNQKIIFEVYRIKTKIANLYNQ